MFNYVSEATEMAADPLVDATTTTTHRLETRASIIIAITGKRAYPRMEDTRPTPRRSQSEWVNLVEDTVDDIWMGR